MRAELVDEPIPPLRIAERQQPFRQQLDPDRRALVLRQFLAQQGRDPVAAEQLPHVSAGAGLADELILLRSEHDENSCRSPASGGSGSCLARVAPTGTSRNRRSSAAVPIRPEHALNHAQLSAMDAAFVNKEASAPNPKFA